MTKEPKKRSPGRPALPTSEKKGRNFTFRSRGDMHERLQVAAVNSGRSISEEIEVRLAQSFEMESRMTAFREEWEKRIEDHRQLADILRKRAEESRAEVKKISEETKQQIAEQSAEFKMLEQELDKHVAAANMVDVLIGENEASRDLLRKIALELMSNPNWDGNKAMRKAMADKIHAFMYPLEVFEREDSSQQFSGA